MEKQTEKTINALRNNGMNAFYAENSVQLCEIIKEILPAGCTIASGGSQTLKESGILSLISKAPYRYLDRNRYGITPEEKLDIYRSTVGCDFYFCSANAVTEDGELINVDGIGNRVSALAFGPEKVIVVAGINKLVKNTEMGLLRIKREAAPKNAVRLGLDTPCAKLGHCIALEGSANPAFTEGCSCESRICASYLITARQMQPGRITVAVCGEILGY